jgi:DNA-binding MarR family transcriptional regulator
MFSSDRDVRSGARQAEVSEASYRQLAEFRYQIRKFLHFTEEAARACHIEPQQHQFLRAIKGLPEGARPTVTTLSKRLCLRHHSTVELIDRLVEQGASTRRQSDQDHREVLVELSAHGEELLNRLSALLLQELRVTGSVLAVSLLSLVNHSIETGKGGE